MSCQVFFNSFFYSAAGSAAFEAESEFDEDGAEFDEDEAELDGDDESPSVNASSLSHRLL